MPCFLLRVTFSWGDDTGDTQGTGGKPKKRFPSTSTLSIKCNELSGPSYRHMGNPKTVPLWKKHNLPKLSVELEEDNSQWRWEAGGREGVPSERPVKPSRTSPVWAQQAWPEDLLEGGVIMLWPKDRGSHAMLRGPCSILWVLCSSDGASLTSVRKISAAPKPMWDEGGPPAAHAGSDKILLS